MRRRPTSETSLLRQSDPRRTAILAWLRLARVYQKVDRITSERIRSYGLSMAQFDVLAHVGASEGVTQQELADSLLVTKGNICQLLDRMEGSDLIRRRQEGRANRLFLSDKGRELFDRVVPAQEQVIGELISSLTCEEQVQLLDTLRKLDRSLG